MHALLTRADRRGRLAECPTTSAKWRESLADHPTPPARRRESAAERTAPLAECDSRPDERAAPPAEPRRASAAHSSAVIHNPWALRAPAVWLRAALQAGLIFPLLGLVCRPWRVEGVEHLCGLQPPLLFAARHTSHLDTPSLLRALPPHLRHRTAVAAAADYFYASAPLGALATLLFNTFPFPRHARARAGLERAAALLQAGWCVLLYPQGTRCPPGVSLSCKGGIGLLARDGAIAIVPVAALGAEHLLPRGRLLPRRGPLTVRFGPALHVAPDADPRATATRVGSALEALCADDASVPSQKAGCVAWPIHRPASA